MFEKLDSRHIPIKKYKFLTTFAERDLNSTLNV